MEINQKIMLGILNLEIVGTEVIPKIYLPQKTLAHQVEKQGPSDNSRLQQSMFGLEKKDKSI